MYKNFSACTQVLSDVEEIDYYFAAAISKTSRDTMSADDYGQWFHILLLLCWQQRHGHSCLLLSDIGQTRVFDNAQEGKGGFCFAEYSHLLPLVAARVEAEGNQQLHLCQGRLYTQRYWCFENDIVNGIQSRQAGTAPSNGGLDRAQIVQLWPHLFTDPQGQQDWQQVATAAALLQSFTIISGGPGTGKTYTVARLIIALLGAFGSQLTIKLAAPTGKASQRLGESIQEAIKELNHIPAVAALMASVPKEAQTLHRLLGIAKWGVGCKLNAQNPLDCDVLIVDESSMIDVALMARLMRALKPSTRLILVGDPHQLPAVESGNVLADLVGEKTSLYSPQLAAKVHDLRPELPSLAVSETAKVNDHVFTLRSGHRFEGPLAWCAKAIQQGDWMHAWQSVESTTAVETTSLTGVGQLSIEQGTKTFGTLVSHWFNGVIGATGLAEAHQALVAGRWLTPVRQGALGAVQLNMDIEQSLSHTFSHVRINGNYQGRPIMVVENSYSQGLSNGDVGIIWPAEDGKLKAWFEIAKGDFKSYPLSRLPRVETVFAMTIHKSQGSEFERILVWLPELTGQGKHLCSRELLYTGLTRAKAAATLICEQETFAQAVATQQQRMSGIRALMAASGEALGMA
jgi:exodeoxyribonuclease V alpha subunit